MKANNKLPIGQKERSTFPRFGMPQFANRFPKNISKVNLKIYIEQEKFELGIELKTLSRIKQISDFHCVTSWSKNNLHWSGYYFKDFYNTFILPKTSEELKFVVLKGADGYRTSLPLTDLMKNNVLIADTLNNQPLGIEHGAPIRIIAPNHYGYKNVKHIERIEFYTNSRDIKKGIPWLMDHPRARVDYEERVTRGPNILFRYVYRLAIGYTIKIFEKATIAYKLKKK